MSDRDRIFDAETLASAETAASAAERATAPARPGAIGANGPVPGQTWARYVVLDPLGEGGMGAVWSAFDTELERKVALKVLHDELLGRASQERLRREARAMARVAHPNVVPVFDVGEHAGRSFYTMELVRGQSLRDWAREPRDPREVARVFVDAARGLAAIHAAGLVHRDVKPGNLLLGDDGRARIADLGIAMSAPEALPDETPLVATTTLRHAGTPAYMAPEQLRGAAGDAASDQFSFGVALWEALHGQPPFGGESVEARLAAFAAGPIGARDVPGWLDAAARRAMANDPAARFADVASLARALEGPRARRWPIALGVIAAAGAAAAATVILIGRGAPTPAPPRDTCATAGGDLDQAWTARRASPFARSTDSLAPDPAALSDDLDRAIGAWRSAAHDACTRDQRGAWSPQVGARAARCLARRRGELSRAIASPDVGVLSTRLAAIGPSARCLDPDYVASDVEPPSEPARVALINGTDALLRVALDIANDGAPDPAQAILDHAGTLPVALDYAPLAALRGTTAAQIAIDRGDLRRAADLFEKNYYAARAAGDDDDALEAMTGMIDLAATKLDDRALAEKWIDLARADAARRPNSEAAASVFDSIAGVEMTWGNAAAAVDDARKAADLERTIAGDNSPVYFDAVGVLAAALDTAGHHREALPYYDKVIQHVESWYGHDSPALLNAVRNEAYAESDIGESARAIKLARWAAEITDAWRDAPDHERGYTDLCLGITLLNAEQQPDAVAPLERAVAELREAYGDDHRDVAMAMSFLAQVREATTPLGDAPGRARSLEDLRAAAAAELRASGPDDPEAISAQLYYGDGLMARGACDRAIPIAHAQLATLERVGDKVTNGPKYVEHGLRILGQCQLSAHAYRDAIAALTRALAVPGDDPSHVDRADVHRSLAIAYLNQGDRDRAIAAERERREDLSLAGVSAEQLAHVDAWLASPNGPPP